MYEKGNSRYEGVMACRNRNEDFRDYTNVLENFFGVVIRLY